jgi:hypothetical protein
MIMRRERIMKAAGGVREALNAAQIRELLWIVRSGPAEEGDNRTQRILLAYHEFMRHYYAFGEEEKDLLAFLGLTPLLEVGFWSGLLEGGPAIDRKALTDVEVAAYNVIFVMPKLRELLARETDKGELIIADGRASGREIKCLRVLVAERERSLTDPSTIINLIRAMNKLYDTLSVSHAERSVSLAIGSIDSGSAKSFDFFGATPVMDEIASLLLNVWDRVKYCAEETYGHQIELAMVAAGFLPQSKNAQTQSTADDELAQRTMRIVAKCIEMLFRSGAYTEEMDAPTDMRASRILGTKARSIQFKEESMPIEPERDNVRQSLEPKVWPTTPSVVNLVPAVFGILPKRSA